MGAERDAEHRGDPLGELCEYAEAGEPRRGGHPEQRAEQSPVGKQERQALSERTQK